MTAGTIPSNSQRRLQPLRKPRSPAFFRLSASKAGYNPWFRTVVSKSGPPRFDRKTKASELGAGYVSKNRFRLSIAFRPPNRQYGQFDRPQHFCIRLPARWTLSRTGSIQPFMRVEMLQVENLPGARLYLRECVRQRGLVDGKLRANRNNTTTGARFSVALPSTAEPYPLPTFLLNAQTGSAAL